MQPKKFVIAFLVGLVQAILNRRILTRKQIVLSAMVTDLLDYCDGRLTEDQLDRSFVAFECYVKKFIRPGGTSNA